MFSRISAESQPVYKRCFLASGIFKSAKTISAKETTVAALSHGTQNALSMAVEIALSLQSPSKAFANAGCNRHSPPDKVTPPPLCV